ncbi:MAG: undecaprenyldiphospho-muramoylpentapeptide beta-N-acetylglucosaminyltransferase [Calditrichaeota bacterium]|nr:MAG: undecaprenyldiphospho-muramoylpentapeptide beta-N-acetylglucosaminyltransferase [Calditrichota bacterium]
MGSKFRIAIAGGGTGGHLYPGLAIADYFKHNFPGSEIIFMGTAKGIENKIVPAQGYKLYLLPVRGLLRKISLQNFLFPFRLLLSVCQAWVLLRRFQPQIVIGTGGYVAGPPLLAARLLKIPTAIQEQNSFPGLVNRKLGNKVDLVCAAFSDSEKYFSGQKNFYLTGNPVRLQQGEIDKKNALKNFDLQPDKKNVLIFGGSQGANRINEVVAEILPELAKNDDVQIIWIVGPVSEVKWKHLENKYPENVRVLGYVENMALAYSIADVAICRAGAMTISEITLFGIPAIFIPFPYATADHQTKNAQSVVQTGAALLIDEKNLNEEKLTGALMQLLSDSTLMAKMKKATSALAKPDATKNIVNHCVALIEKSMH